MAQLIGADAIGSRRAVLVGVTQKWTRGVRIRKGSGIQWGSFGDYSYAFEF